MNKIFLEKTEYTPLVKFDHIDFSFEIKGESSPEDARQFYAPLIKWVDDFRNYLYFLNDKVPTKKSLEFIFHMDYVTSSSLKNIYDLLVKIETLKPHVEGVKIKWIHDKDDEDMEENGIEFSKMLNIPFEVCTN
jgi:hypothetical protein